MPFEEVISELSAVRAGKLEALVVAKRGGAACRPHTVEQGDTLQIVVVHDWPRNGVNFTKVRIKPAGESEPVKEARYSAPRIRDLTRRNRLSSHPVWSDEALELEASI